MKTFVFSLLNFLFLFGCASEERERPMAPAEIVGPVVYAVDPVSDVGVRTDSVWKTCWNHKWYYFTSQENLLKFQAEPTAYVRARELCRKIYPYQAQ